MNNIIYDPNFIPNQPIYTNNSINEERIIPFLGGALIGGLGGAAIANQNNYGGYYGGGYYPYYYSQPVYYYPSGYYTSYPVYPYQTAQTTTNNAKRSY